MSANSPDRGPFMDSSRFHRRSAMSVASSCQTIKASNVQEISSEKRHEENFMPKPIYFRLRLQAYCGSGETREQETTFDAIPPDLKIDLPPDLRPVIFSLFCQLGFTELEGLCVEDQVTLTEIEAYLDIQVNIK
ncbi:unnamed protein product [Protopolystoma xenopodis]|uniref:Cilia- and flagella-associated protein 69 ARM repeats domain-containing protein n=1 Tax=Protopolystoma xenopodis TaxID=117903 RepID=A0A3S5CQ12_9PLAT|nr:unnamed protein product [Protopolystoma xenopodis]